MARYIFEAAADNHSVTRNYITGTADTEQGARKDIIILQFADRAQADVSGLYLLDYGTEVVACYVAGWNPNRPGEVWIQPFPVTDGTQLRADNGRPVDYSNWQLGPRKAYHFKLQLQEG